MSQPQPQIDPQTRFNAIFDQIARTERGRGLVDWLAEKQIKAGFVKEAAFIAHYDEEQDSLSLNWQMPDAVLHVYVLDQLRRAWQAREARAKTLVPTPLSYLLQKRFEEADARSFATAMVMDYTKQTGDFSVLEALTSQDGFQPMFKYAAMVSHAPNHDFNLMRRAAFDSFFPAFQEQLAEFEESFIKDFIATTKEMMAVLTEETVTGFFDKRRRSGKKDNDDVLVLSTDINDPENPERNFKAQRYDTLSMQDLTAYGQNGFGQSGNYLTETPGPAGLDSEFYLASGKAAKSALTEFVQKSPLIAHLNILGTPLKKTTPAAPKPQAAPKQT